MTCEGVGINWELPNLVKVHCTSHKSCLKPVWLRTGRKEVV